LVLAAADLKPIPRDANTNEDIRHKTRPSFRKASIVFCGPCGVRIADNPQMQRLMDRNLSYSSDLID